MSHPKLCTSNFERASSIHRLIQDTELHAPRHTCPQSPPKSARRPSHLAVHCLQNFKNQRAPLGHVDVNTPSVLVQIFARVSRPVPAAKARVLAVEALHVPLSNAPVSNPDPIVTVFPLVTARVDNNQQGLLVGLQARKSKGVPIRDERRELRGPSKCKVVEGFLSQN